MSFFSQTHTWFGPWRLRICVTWPLHHPCHPIATIPTYIVTCTWNPSPWFRSTRLGQPAAEVVICNRVRCSTSCYSIHKDKSETAWNRYISIQFEKMLQQWKEYKNGMKLTNSLSLSLCVKVVYLFTKQRRESTQILLTALSMLRYWVALSSKNQVHACLHMLYVLLFLLNALNKLFFIVFVSSRFDAGCWELIFGPKLPVHKMAAASTEQMDSIMWRHWKRTVGALQKHCNLLHAFDITYVILC